MRLIFRTIISFSFCIIWCEYLYYYLNLQWNCPEWPGPLENTTKILVISDTHIMGDIKSFRLDKLRREWQMEQAFQISNKFYSPDVIIFLGDILDEGLSSSDKNFEKVKEDFNRIFRIDQSKQKRIIIPGNHDVGLHPRMLLYPYPLERFSEAFDATPNIELVTDSSQDLGGLNIISMNSMSFSNDDCYFCSHSTYLTNRISSRLMTQGAKESDQNNSDSSHSHPILLTHIPLYRLNDQDCVHPDRMSERVKKENIEGDEVLHHQASQFILSKLRPRLILSGHTHMRCETSHKLPSTSKDDQQQVKEITVSSYNHKYAEKHPEFLLLAANSTHTFTKHCELIDEKVIIIIYSLGIAMVFLTVGLSVRRMSSYTQL